MKPRPLSLTHWHLASYIEANARGKHAAITLPEVASALKLTTRKVQELKAELLEVAGVVICSSCGNPPGLYWPMSAEEVQPYHAQQANREKASRKAKQAIERKYPQLRQTHLRTPPLTIRPTGRARQLSMGVGE